MKIQKKMMGTSKVQKETNMDEKTVTFKVAYHRHDANCRDLVRVTIRVSADAYKRELAICQAILDDMSVSYSYHEVEDD